MAPRWSRWIPLSGILFVALTLVGLGVGGGVDVNVADEEVLAHFADGGETSADVAGFFITAVGALFFLVFLNSLRARLAAAEGPRGTVAGLVSSAGSCIDRPVARIGCEHRVDVRGRRVQRPSRGGSQHRSHDREHWCRLLHLRRHGGVGARGGNIGTRAEDGCASELAGMARIRRSDRATPVDALVPLAGASPCGSFSSASR